MRHNHNEGRGYGCVICQAAITTDDHRGLDRRALLAAFAAVPATGLIAAPAQSHAKVARQQRGSLIVEPSWTLVWRDGKPELLRDHSVVIEGDTIVRISEGRIDGENRRIAMPGQLLVPGLISAHTHTACGSPTRGLIESGGRSYSRPLEIMETLDDADLDALTAYNLAELLRSGCTAQVEQSVSLKQAQSYVRVARRWGVRGFPGGMVPGWRRVMPIWRRSDDKALFASVADTLSEIDANLAFALSVNGAEEGLIRPMMAPHGPETHTPDTLRAVAKAALQLGNGIHTHLATSPGDSERIRKLWGKAPVQWIDEFGFYEQRLFGAHMTGWDAVSDAPFLAKKPHFTFAHCPSGAGAGSGQSNQPFIEALGAGFNSAVGVDTHSNDMVENMKLALLYGRARHSLIAGTSPVPVKRPSVADMIAAATLHPANGLGREDLGRIAVGAKADLASIDVSGLLVGPGFAPPEPLNNLLYANGMAVRNVMTAGRVQVLDGRLTVDDEAHVIARGATVVQRIWRQMFDEGWFA
ncbi:cytosine/adenosine deaminase-related metal-dependent hydrolase [Sphingosinicella microcystinivorans]|uniref:Cytosine/adenosine deaminase-related metal-dependent hydrolase n=3 Tax=Sphingosinicella microcystinivorans TaxID=335406 RepID=A0ABX9T1R6_SPHMI|nr:cytosine/adenosine deaminase-related metal-dependent hydrolase [Sphingosinicella microcystinivorans]